MADRPKLAEQSDGDVLERWEEHLGDLWREVVQIKMQRQLFKELDGEIGRAKVSGSDLVTDYLRRSYRDTQAMAIRTLVDRDLRSRSFYNLLEEMAQRCSLLSRERFRIRHKLNEKDAAELGIQEDDLTVYDKFDKIAGGPDVAHVPASVFYDYQDQLVEAVGAVKRFTDKLIAHRDLRSAPELTWGELDGAIDSLESHVNNVALALNGIYLMTDTRLPTDWREVFRRGLFIDPE